MLKGKKLIFILLLFSLLIRLFILLISDDITPLDVWGFSFANVKHYHTPPLSIYLGRLAHLLNDSPMAIRIPNLILGSLLIIPFYYLAKILYNQEIALFSSLVLCGFYPHINMSVVSNEYIPLYFLFF